MPAAVHDYPISDDDEELGAPGGGYDAPGLERWLPQSGQTSVTDDMLHERQARRREAFGAQRGGRGGASAASGGVTWDASLSARGLGDVPTSGAKMAVAHRHAAGVSARRRPGAATSGNTPAVSLHPFPAAAKKPPSSARAAAQRPRSATPTRGSREGLYSVEEMAERLEQLKRAYAALEQENKGLRAASARSDAQLRRAEREAEESAATGAILDGVGALGGMSRGEAHLLKNLKGQVRELQRALREKEAALAELSTASKSTRLKELQVFFFPFMFLVIAPVSTYTPD